MLTEEEIQFLKDCSDTEYMQAIIDRCSSTPRILITIKNGCYNEAHADSPIEIIIKDEDDITEDGADLFFTSPETTDKESFEKHMEEICLNIILLHAKTEQEPVKDVRIFCTAPDAIYPYDVLVNGEFTASFKTVGEAAEFLQKYIEAKGKRNGK